MKHLKLFENNEEESEYPMLPDDIMDFIGTFENMGNYDVVIKAGLAADPNSPKFNKMGNFSAFNSARFDYKSKEGNLTIPACFVRIRMKSISPNFKIENTDGLGNIFFYSGVDNFEGFISKMMFVVEQIEEKGYRCYFSLHGPGEFLLFITQ